LVWLALVLVRFFFAAASHSLKELTPSAKMIFAL
jgi:hypothetical protein